MLLKPRAGLGIQNSGCKFVLKSRNRKFVGADNGVKRFSHCAKKALLTKFRACVSGSDFHKVYTLRVSEQVLFNS